MTQSQPVNASELLPCPFCGDQKPNFVNRRGDQTKAPSWGIACDGDCGLFMFMPDYDETKDEVAKVWNARATPNPSQNAVTGSSGTHPVTEGAADNAPPANSGVQSEQEPVAWIVTWRTKHTPKVAAAYLNEADAKRAAANVKSYADASDVVVIPTFAASSLTSADRGREAREKEITRLATIEECAQLIESGAGMADLIDQDDLDEQAKMIRALASRVSSTNHPGDGTATVVTSHHPLRQEQ